MSCFSCSKGEKTTGKVLVSCCSHIRLVITLARNAQNTRYHVAIAYLIDTSPNIAHLQIEVCIYSIFKVNSPNWGHGVAYGTIRRGRQWVCTVPAKENWSVSHTHPTRFIQRCCVWYKLCGSAHIDCYQMQSILIKSAPTTITVRTPYSWNKLLLRQTVIAANCYCDKHILY